MGNGKVGGPLMGTGAAAIAAAKLFFVFGLVARLFCAAIIPFLKLAASVSGIFPRNFCPDFPSKRPSEKSAAKAS